MKVTAISSLELGLKAMWFLQKNLLLKSVTNLRKCPQLLLHQSKRDHIFKTAAADAAAAAAGNKQTLLLRRTIRSDVDEGKIISELRRLIPYTTLCHPTSNSIYSPEVAYYCGSAASCYTVLSPHDFSPVETQTLTLDFPHFSDYHFCGSCNGVICLENNGPTYEEAVFWNPTTNQVKLLPRCEDYFVVLEYPETTNALTSISASGFGFDSKTGDYKLIRWILSHYEWRYPNSGTWFSHYELRDPNSGTWFYDYTDWSVHVYSLNKDSWEAVVCPYNFCSAASNETACFNGHAYWPFHASLSNTPHHNILCFDFSTQLFSTFPFPHTRKIYAADKFRLLERGGRLAIVFHPKQCSERELYSEDEGMFEIWTWNSNGEGGGRWSKDFDGLIEGVVFPLGFSEDGEVLFLAGVDGMLHVFDVGTKKLRKLDIYCNRQRFDLIRYEECRVQLE